jgi:hypothetical protein
MTNTIEFKEELKKLYLDYGQDIVKYIADLLLKNGKKASGSLIKSLKPEVKIIGEQVLLLINSNDYFDIVDKGRKPGKYVPVNAIKNWCRLKGIDEKYSFVINRSIFKNGIKGLNILNKSLQTKIETNMVKIVDDLILTKIEEQIKDTFKI